DRENHSRQKRKDHMRPVPREYEASHGHRGDHLYPHGRTVVAEVIDGDGPRNQRAHEQGYIGYRWDSLRDELHQKNNYHDGKNQYREQQTIIAENVAKAAGKLDARR